MEPLESETTRKVNEGITSVRSYDTKSITKPTEWSGNVDEYVVWKVLVVAFMTTLDRRWNTIAEHVIGHADGNLSKKLLDDEQVEEFLKQHDIDVSLKGHSLETLLITVLQCTDGDVKAMVNALGERGAFQAISLGASQRDRLG